MDLPDNKIISMQSLISLVPNVDAQITWKYIVQLKAEKRRCKLSWRSERNKCRAGQSVYNEDWLESFREINSDNSL